MTVNCFFCNGPVNPHDLGTWKQVAGWVGGPRKDSMTMREDTGVYAHDKCVHKAQAGQSADQPDLFGEEKPDTRVYKELALGDLKTFKKLLEDED